MKSAASLLALAAAIAVPAGSAVAKAAHPAPAAVEYGPQGDYPVTVGDPFTVEGVTYTPSDTMNYDAVGYAGQGGGAGVSAAHRTLPVPSYIEVTSLETGHTALVRVDRRGPMSGGSDRLVELSPAAWAQLGITTADHSPVRVRRVNPPEQERALLRTGQNVPARMDTPPGLLAALKRKLGIATPIAAALPDEIAKATPVSPAKTTMPVTAPRPAGAVGKGTIKQSVPPTPKAVAAPPSAQPPKPAASPKVEKPAEPKARPAPAPKPAAGGVAVQVGAYSARDRAEKVAAQVGGTVTASGKFFRVRIPASSSADAQAALAKARRSGYADATVVHGQ